MTGCKLNTGIYRIRNINTDAAYIGSAHNLKRRFSQHRLELSKGIHHSQRLQNAWTKHGANAFVLEVLVLCEAADLIMYEQRLMDLFKSYDRRLGYNILPKADSRQGLIHTEAAKAKSQQQ